MDQGGAGIKTLGAADGALIYTAWGGAQRGPIEGKRPLVKLLLF